MFIFLQQNVCQFKGPDMQEEMNICYVAITRARRICIIVGQNQHNEVKKNDFN